MFHLDTNIISDLVRNPSGHSARRLAEVGIGNVSTSTIVAGELRYGYLKNGMERRAERVETALERIGILPIDEAVAAEYGVIRRALEAGGMMIGQNDLWIAAHARTLNATLVTANEREFRRVEGLAVENWLAA